ICNRNHFHGALYASRASLASAHGIRRDSRAAQSEGVEAWRVVPFLCRRIASRRPTDSVPVAGLPFQFSCARKFVGGRLRDCAGSCVGMVRRLGKALCGDRSRQTTALFSWGVVAVFRGGVPGRRWFAFGPDSNRCADDRGTRHSLLTASNLAIHGAHLPRMAAQLLADWPAKESSLCGIGDFSCTALPQPCSPCRYLAGAAASAGGFGVHSVVCAGDFYRAFATRARQADLGNGATRNGPRAATYGGNSAGGATRQPREPAVFHRAPNKRRIRAGVGATSFP